MRGAQVWLGSFSRWGIAAWAKLDQSVFAEAALAHYVRRLASNDPPVGVPEFCRQAYGCTSVPLSAGSGTHDVLEFEARRQRVTVEQLTAHAILVYLADLDIALGGDGDAAGAP
jgi:hypothetical protein